MKTQLSLNVVLMMELSSLVIILLIFVKESQCEVNSSHSETRDFQVFLSDNFRNGKLTQTYPLENHLYGSINSTVEKEIQYLPEIMSEFEKEKISEELRDEVKNILDVVYYENSFIYALILLVVIYFLSDFKKVSSIFQKPEQKKQILYDPGPPLTDGEKLYYPGDYIRPLEGIEIYFFKSLIAKSFSTHQAVWIKTKQKIRKDYMKKAIEILARRVPVLQYCIGLKGYRLWFRRRTTRNIDYSYTEGDALCEYTKNLTTHFDPWEGPLWSARLIECTDNNSIREGKFKYLLLFNVHHIISDATTNMMFCRETVQILNSLHSGVQVDEKPREISLPCPVRAELSSWETLKINLKFFGRGFLHLTTYHMEGPWPLTKHQTKIMRNDLTEEETKNFLRACKQNGIRVNSVVMAASVFAYRQTQKKFNYSGNNGLYFLQAVNFRRYCPPGKNTDGCYISSLITPSSIRLKGIDRFWDHASDCQIYMDTTLKKKGDLKVSKLCETMIYSSIIAHVRPYLLTRDQLDYNYCLTNMNRIDEHLPEARGNDFCEIVDVIRSISGGHNHFPFTVTFHTFRGKLMFSMDYYTNHITEKCVKQYFTYLMQNIRQLSSFGYLTNEVS